VSSRKPKKADSRFAYGGLDRVIHERARLSVLTSLITQADGLMFNDLKDLCALTDGNLNRHLLVLEESKLVNVVKSFDGTRQVTRCRVTALGRRRYLEYLSVLEQVILDGTRARQTDMTDSESGARKP
jgi:DNA-binding MarR family transcriptional regulator